MSARNPSPTLQLSAIDDIVDRALRGRYETKRPVRAIEAVKSGLFTVDKCREYVYARYSARAGNERMLSSAGVTMRSNKLFQRLSPLIEEFKRGDSPELVWKVSHGSYGNTICYATGGRLSARSWAFTLFGWTIDKAKEADLYCEFAGVGGISAAAIENTNLIGTIQKSIAREEASIKQCEARIEKFRALVDTVITTAAHLSAIASPA